LTTYSNISSEFRGNNRWLGFDFGLKRSGFAVSDPGAVLASPLCVLPTEPQSSLPGRLIGELVQRQISPAEIGGLVCGLPLSERGAETEMSAQAQEAARQLVEALATSAGCQHELQLEFVDERYSSREMLARGSEIGIRGPERRRRLDAWAATSILQGWLDRRRSQHS
jgi:putative Holliday junction resolvase